MRCRAFERRPDPGAILASRLCYSCGNVQEARLSADSLAREHARRKETAHASSFFSIAPCETPAFELIVKSIQVIFIAFCLESPSLLLCQNTLLRNDDITHASQRLGDTTRLPQHIVDLLHTGH